MIKFIFSSIRDIFNYFLNLGIVQIVKKDNRYYVRKSTIFGYKYSSMYNYDMYWYYGISASDGTLQMWASTEFLSRATIVYNYHNKDFILSKSKFEVIKGEKNENL